MLTKQNRNLLPKRLADRVALKTKVSQHQLLRFWGSKKLIKFPEFKFTRIFLGILVILYFSGYQPTLAIPPIKKAVAEAATFSQFETIEAANFTEPFNLPHPGYISTRFSSWHPGIDIATGLGMPIRPISKGVIAEVSLGFWGLGHYVVVEHEQGFRSTYGHMGKVFVRPGDPVEATSVIGTVGMTGRTTGPHTHLEVTRSNSYVDPLTILPEISNWPTSAGEAPTGSGETKVVEEVKPPIQPIPVNKLSFIDLSKAGQTPDPKPNTNKLTLLLLPLKLQQAQP